MIHTIDNMLALAKKMIQLYPADTEPGDLARAIVQLVERDYTRGERDQRVSGAPSDLPDWLDAHLDSIRHRVSRLEEK